MFAVKGGGVFLVVVHVGGEHGGYIGGMEVAPFPQWAREALELWLCVVDGGDGKSEGMSYMN